MALPSPGCGVRGSAVPSTDPFLQTDAAGRSAASSRGPLRLDVGRVSEVQFLSLPSRSRLPAGLTDSSANMHRTRSTMASNVSKVQEALELFAGASERLRRARPEPLEVGGDSARGSSSGMEADHVSPWLISGDAAGLWGRASARIPWESEALDEPSGMQRAGTKSRSIWGVPLRGTPQAPGGGEYVALPTEDVDTPFGIIALDDEEEEELSACGRLRKSVKIVLEDPSSSLLASFVQYGMLALIFFSVGIAIIETEPSQQDNAFFKACGPVFTVLFSVEMVCRYWTCDSTRVFFSSAFNIIDVLATLPCYTDLLLLAPDDGAARHISNSFQTLRLAGLVRVARLFRLLRILRVANTMRQSEMIIVVLRSVHGSLSGIWVLFTFMFVGMILSATMAYCCEMSDPTAVIVSIPVAMWWASTTITAVGYGDTLPKTLAGKMVAVTTMFLGLVIIAVCIAVVTNSFTIQFQREMYSSRVRGMQRKLLKRQRREGSEEATSGGGSPKRHGFLSETPTGHVSQRWRSRSQTRAFNNAVARAPDQEGGSSLTRSADEESPHGPKFFDRDFAAMVSQLEDMAESLLLGMEALIDEGVPTSPSKGCRSPIAEPSASPITAMIMLGRPGSNQPEIRCARMTLEMLRGNNRLWFEQARSLSEELLRMSEADDPAGSSDNFTRS